MTYAKVMQNLDERYPDATGNMRSMLIPGQYVYAYGVFYPDSDRFAAKQVTFSGRMKTDYLFEKQDWWIHQIDSMGNFYVKSQFGDGEIDYRHYRTSLSSYQVEL